MQRPHDGAVAGGAISFSWNCCWRKATGIRASAYVSFSGFHDTIGWDVQAQPWNGEVYNWLGHDRVGSDHSQGTPLVRERSTVQSCAAAPANTADIVIFRALASVASIHLDTERNGKMTTRSVENPWTLFAPRSGIDGSNDGRQIFDRTLLRGRS